jgi:hypothetical protein
MDKETVEELCQYFHSIFTSEAKVESVQRGGIDPPGVSIEIKVDEEIVRKKLQGLRRDKAAGPDDIHPQLLRECAKSMSVPLTIIFCKSLSEGAVPSDWKRANVTPIHKKGSRSQCENY